MVAMARPEPKKTLLARAVRWRAGVQSLFAAIWLFPLLRIHTFCAPVFHCYSCPLALFACPIGIMAQFSAAHIFPFIAVGVVLVAGALLGSFICGWVCPFGFFQDLAARVPTPKLRLPTWLGYGRYVVLVGLVFLVPYLWGTEHWAFICSICPAGMLEAAVPSMVSQAFGGQVVTWPNMIKVGVTVFVVGAMFFKFRPWCTLLCPLGAIFGACNKVSAAYLKVNGHTCTSCGACRKQCPVGVKPDVSPNHSSCVRCLKCTRCSSLGVGLMGVGERKGKAAAEVEPDA